PYVFNWIHNNNVISVEEDISGLSPGKYYLKVIDDNGCEALTDTLTITEPPPVNVTPQISGVKCYGESNGVILLTVTGGTSPYSFTWTTNDGSGLVPDAQDQTTLTEGTYSVTITDINGCRISESYTITQPDPIIITENVTNPTCPDETNGSIEVTVSGGIAPYSYMWSTGESGESITGLLAGTYTVTVTDGNLCTESKDIDLIYVGSSCLRIPTVLTPNGDGQNDTWRIGNIEMYPHVKIDIYTRWGKHIFHSQEGYPNPWDGTYEGRLMPMDSYTYIIDLGDGSKPIVGNITIIR
ncbi:MAG: gliding motility-associated C-terminal domain-containing protein, partial [Bacteroidales bacterium]|nr:gliding motility-associated C-terminal domain-containing protein [Bacteroidales bacterium]